MSNIKEHDYLKVCAQLASLLSISISAAKKKIDLEAAKKGAKDLASRKEIATQLLEKVSTQSLKDTATTSQLDNLLAALAEEENFMVED